MPSDTKTTTREEWAACPACHHPDHDPGSCPECPHCELHYDDAIAWLDLNNALPTGPPLHVERLARAMMASGGYIDISWHQTYDDWDPQVVPIPDDYLVVAKEIAAAYEKEATMNNNDMRELRAQLASALLELGVPDETYPAPIVNAIQHIERALDIADYEN